MFFSLWKDRNKEAKDFFFFGKCSTQFEPQDWTFLYSNNHEKKKKSTTKQKKKGKKQQKHITTPQYNV